MTDISTLSDAELKALYAQPAASAAPKALADMSDAELQSTWERMNASPAADVAKSAGIGLVKGTIGLLGAPSDLADLGAKGIRKGTSFVLNKLGLPDDQAPLYPGTPKILPGSADIRSALEENVTGPLYEPKTRAGRYAQTIAEFAPGAAIGPGGLIPKLTKFAAIPGAVTERAGEMFPDNPWARVAGALLGTAGGAGVGRLATGAQNVAAATSGARELGNRLQIDVPVGAVRRMGESATADKLTPAGAAATAAELGPETMVMDLGRQLRGRAEAIASQPGAGQNRVLDAVEGRTGIFGAETANRVRQTLDAEMGQSHNVVELQSGVEKIVDKYAKPLYDKVMADHPVVDVPTSITARPAVAQAMKDAVSLAKNRGEQLSQSVPVTKLNAGGVPVTQNVSQAAQPSLRYWDYVKKAIDSRINGMIKKGGIEDLNSAEKADLGGLLDAKKSLVSHLDDVTGGVYAQARQVAATKPQLKEALEFGQSGFSSKLLPEEFAAQIADMSLPQQTIAKAGFRRELDRLIDSARNEGATARRVLDTNQVRQKIEALFGPQAAQAIERRIAAETTFQEATQDIARNSRTAVRGELVKDTATPSTAAISNVTIPGMAAASGRAGLNYIRGQGMSRTRDALGEMLSATGPQRDAVVDAILRYQQRRAANAVQSGAPVPSAISGVIQALQGGR